MISGKRLKQTELPVRPVVTPGPWWNLHKSGIFHGQAFQRPTIPRPQTTVVSVVKPVKRIKTRHLFIGSHPTKPGNEHSACKVVERSLLTIPQSLSRASPALSCRILLGVRVPPLVSPQCPPLGVRVPPHHRAPPGLRVNDAVIPLLTLVALGRYVVVCAHCPLIHSTSQT